MKFRIVEERSIVERNGKTLAVPVFYVENSHRKFIFWIRWDRYFQRFETRDQAEHFLDAVQEEYNFKSRVITRS